MEKRLNKQYPSVSMVTGTEHAGMVKEIFSTITKRYDFLNHFLSMRRDVAWRRFTVKKMRFFLTGRFLDVACGTSDLAIMTAKRFHDVQSTGVDFVQAMLVAGRKKIYRKGLGQDINLANADALSLPFKDNTFDVAAIAFGIRNIPDRTAALGEMIRVIVPDGQVMVLEMTYIRNRLFKRLYHLYLNFILPGIAGLLSFNPAAYLYLADSIMNFPSPERFAGLMGEAGLTEVKKYKLTFGITYLYTGIKPGNGKS
ncbi:MAG: bifunctional demethylmenaquinone methyltransferase/2-methoxy-6-polyprenyl-1,4-benzoquinol methylase UbiE [Proteobacteria bacterium]|nr:bifunctional demethylmenaquinone methyltransferase/2-methoxy-6-polyprenyl-1,4-benzoquinol methylase UbiE [Pseudomonadota bacterium]